MTNTTTEPQSESMYYCLKCGRRHRERSGIGRDHYALDVTREGFDPAEVAVGIAHVRATLDRRRPEATAEEVAEEFDALGFDEQFPGVDVEEALRERHDDGLISVARHSGKEWYLFLANRRTPRGADRSPEQYHLWMKKYASNYVRA